MGVAAMTRRSIGNWRVAEQTAYQTVDPGPFAPRYPGPRLAMARDAPASPLQGKCPTAYAGSADR